MVYFRMFDKRQVKSIFRLGSKYRLSDEEFRQRGAFIISVMSWTSYEVKSWTEDFAPFNRRFKPDWSALYEYHLEHPNEIKRTHPFLPRLSDAETEDEYYTRLEEYLQSFPDEPRLIDIQL